MSKREADKKLIDLFRAGVIDRGSILEIMDKHDSGVVLTPVGRYELQDFKRLYTIYENGRPRLVRKTMAQQAPGGSTLEHKSLWGRFIAMVQTIRISWKDGNHA